MRHGRLEFWLYQFGIAHLSASIASGEDRVREIVVSLVYGRCGAPVYLPFRVVADCVAVPSSRVGRGAPLTTGLVSFWVITVEFTLTQMQPWEVRLTFVGFAARQTRERVQAKKKC